MIVYNCTKQYNVQDRINSHANLFQQPIYYCDECIMKNTLTLILSNPKKKKTNIAYCRVLQENKCWVKPIILFIKAFNHPHNNILINLFAGEDVRPITQLDWHRSLITKDVKWGKVITAAGCADGFHGASLSPDLRSGLIKLQHFVHGDKPTAEKWPRGRS